jgi:putative exosortase-associated protein (TIGR04073 family)
MTKLNYKNKFLVLFSCILATGCTSYNYSRDVSFSMEREYGPTRKLGRAIGNLAFGSTEIPNSMAEINELNNNEAAFSYGIVRGVGRTFARFGYGLFELFTFPFPTVAAKGTYRPPYNSRVLYPMSGYSEFPPEVDLQPDIY